MGFGLTFTDEMFTKINHNLDAKKKDHPISRTEICIGVNLKDGLSGAEIFINNHEVCEAQYIGRLIEELEMLQKAIKEEAGVIL